MSALTLSRLAVFSHLDARFDPLYRLGIATALVVGCLFRLVPTVFADFPLHDGGLFYVMIETVRASHYALPAVIPFNGTDIPYAYPPLAFYVAAALADLSGQSALDVLRVLPSTVSCGVLVAFSILARTVLTSKLAVTAAVLVFAVLPSGFSYLIVGAGLAKSFGLLFALLGLAFAYRMYRGAGRGTAAAVAILGALAVLSHLEMTWFLAISIAALFVAYGRSREGLVRSALVAFAVLALTAPWWTVVIQRHGLAPFQAASQVGSSLSGAAAADSAAAVLAVGIVAILASIAMLLLPDRRFTLLGWLGLIVALDTRNFAWLPTIPLALAIAAIATESLARLFGRRLDTTQPLAHPVRTSPLADALASGMAIVLVVGSLLAMNLGNSQLDNFGNVNLTHSDRAAMQWVSQETPASSQFLVVTGLAQWSADSISEWFPALAGRVSVVTPQGTEWLPNGEFIRRIGVHATAQECLAADAACLDRGSAESGVSFSHVYVAKRPGGRCCPALTDALRSDPAYRQVYDGPAASIFARVGTPRS